MTGVRRICAFLALVLLLASCGRGGKVIPRSKFAAVYAEMLLADQWLNDHPSERTKADTTLFYDPIFKRFGYSFADYDASVNHYLSDPEKYSRILKKSASILRRKAKHYGEIEDRIREIEKHNALIRGYVSKSFDEDTFLWRKLSDSLGLDSLLLDSLRLDSLRLDSLRIDSLRLDSLRLDSLRRDSLRLDSLRRDSMLVSVHPKFTNIKKKPLK